MSTWESTNEIRPASFRSVTRTMCRAFSSARIVLSWPTGSEKMASSSTGDERLPFVVQSNSPPLAAVGPSDLALATSARGRPASTSLPISASICQACCRDRFRPSFTVSASKRALAG